MQINLLSLSTVKTQLGLTDFTYDADITAMLPIVSNDVRRILNFQYSQSYIAAIENGSDQIDFAVLQNAYFNPFYRLTDLPFELGQVIYHPNIPADTYLSAYNRDTGVYTMSAAATGDGDYANPTIQISQWPVISKMIWYKISKQDTTDATAQKFKSIAYGNVSKTFADSEINSKYSYPQALIDDLGTPYVRAG